MAWIATALAMAAALTAAQPEPGHVTARDPDKATPTTAGETTARLDKIAAEISADGKTAQRIATFDVAWPSSQEEYEAVGHVGIVQIAAIVRDPAELPVKAVYVRNEGGDTPLPLLAMTHSAVPADSPSHAIGAYREDSYYVLPTALAATPGEVLIDLARNRSGMQIMILPLNPPAYSASTAKEPDVDAVVAFFAREFPDALPAKQ